MRPLIVFTPKSMLRNKAAVSDIRDFTEQKFRSVLEESTYTDGDGDRTKVRWVLLTSWQALLRAGRPQDQGQPRWRSDRAHRAARAAAQAAAGRDAGPVPQRRREVLGAGGVGHRRSGQGSAWSCPSCCPDRLAGLKQISRRAIGAVVGLVEAARGRTAGNPR